MKSPFDIIKEQEQEYITGNTQISEHVSFSLKENVDRIEAYLFSKHISGSTDSLGREKPFFNIVTAAANVWFRATDIDRANIRIKSSSSANHTLALLANIKLKQWMREARFGVFLNDWGRTLARYGSAVTKWVEKDGKLTATVVPWNRLIVDAVDFEHNPVIEKHYYTPAQLRANKAFDQETVKALIDNQVSRESMDGDKKDNKADYIEVYELHGELPLSFLTDDENDEETFVQQVHICSFVTGKDGEDVEYSLYSGREKNPYMISHLIKEDGRVMGIGAVEHLFEAQWMVNHNEKAIKDQLDVASKLIFQTSDPSYSSKNVMEIESGSILSHSPNEPLTQIANNSHDITSLQNSAQNWRINGNEQVSTPDAIKGNTMPSATAARQVEALQQESHSLFELMTENKGLALEDMIRTFVIPYLKKQLDTTEEIVATLDDQNIKEIDGAYVPNEARRRINKEVKDKMFALARDLDSEEQFPEAPDQALMEQQVQEELKQFGNQRFIKPSEIPSKTWKTVFKDFEWDAEVEVTNEAHDKLSTLTTLTTIFREVANMGDLETAKTVLNKILEETGVFSPMELMATLSKPVASQMTAEQLPTPQMQT